MWVYGIVVLSAFGIAAIGTPVARAVTRKFGIVDRPDGARKLHHGEIPLAGGYAILPAFALPLLGFLLLRPAHGGALRLDASAPGHIAMLLAGAVVALFMGAVDDKYDLRPRWKLLFQVIAALFAYAGGFRIASVSSPFGHAVFHLGAFALPVTVFWFLACMNAINLVDGIDGLAAGVGFFAMLTGMTVAFLHGNVLGSLLCASLLGAVGGFLLYNFPPASVFLGDAGSMLIGFLVAALSLLGSIKAGTAVGLLIPLLALGLPFFDTVAAIIRRWSRHLPIAAPDRRHIHHLLLSMGLSQRRAVLTLYGICAVLALLALAATLQRNSITGIALAVFGVGAIASTRIFGVDIARVLQRLRQDHENGVYRTKAAVETEKALIRMASAPSVDEVWRLASRVFGHLHLDRAELSLVDSPRSGLRWGRAPAGEHVGDKRIYSLALRDARGRLLGRLDVEKYGNPSPDFACNICALLGRLRDGIQTRLTTLSTGDATPAVRAETPAAASVPAGTACAGCSSPACAGLEVYGATETPTPEG